MVRLDIDLAFSEHEEGRDADVPPFEGTITAAGTEVRIVVSDPSRLPGNGRRTLAEMSTVADALASRGISVTLEGRTGRSCSSETSRAVRCSGSSPGRSTSGSVRCRRSPRCSCGATATGR